MDDLNELRPMCDVKHCPNFQCGEIFEGVVVHFNEQVPRPKPLVVRIHPCEEHLLILGG